MVTRANNRGAFVSTVEDTLTLSAWVENLESGRNLFVGGIEGIIGRCHHLQGIRDGLILFLGRGGGAGLFRERAPPLFVVVILG